MQAPAFRGDWRALIADHLKHGDYRGACAAAAGLHDPRDHRDAMLEINRAMSGAPQRGPKAMIVLKEQAAKLLKFTPYVEMHGKDPSPGAALRIEFNVASTFLGGFHDELRSLMYHKLGAKQHDLADVTAELPDLRFEKMKPPYMWRQAYDGSLLTLHIGDREDNAIELSGRVKKPFSLTPMQGGTLVVAMTYNCHPESRDVGTIYNLQRSDIRISFDPGKEVEDDEDDEGGEE